METPTELVSRFCEAWSENRATAELAAFFVENAVYHNIPLAPITGREASLPQSIRSSAPARQALKASSFASSTSPPTVRS